MKPKACPLCVGVIQVSNVVRCRGCGLTIASVEDWNALPRRDPLQRQKDAVVKWAKIWATGDFSYGNGWHAKLGDAVEALRVANTKRKKP